MNTTARRRLVETIVAIAVIVVHVVFVVRVLRDEATIYDAAAAVLAFRLAVGYTMGENP